MHANFLLGTLRITEEAKRRLRRTPYDLLARHAVNEHGHLTKRETRRNQISMETIGEIVSRYRVDPTDTSQGNILVITYKTWDETLIKLESE